MPQKRIKSRQQKAMAFTNGYLAMLVQDEVQLEQEMNKTINIHNRL